jgi:predicted protein tyrosine phosphatase
MGQRVSADKEPLDLKSIFQLGQDGLQSKPAAFGSQPAAPAFLEGVKHHVKVWKFEKCGRAVVDSPAILCDAHGHVTVNLQKTCSYLILHVHAPVAPGDEDPPTGATAALLEELTSGASASCTPRGLAIEVVTQSEVSGSEGKGQFKYTIFVWHGLNVDPHVKARVFTKAFELDRLLRLGHLWQLGILSTLRNAVALRGSVGSEAVKEDASSPELTPEAADKVRHSGNRLLTAILDGTAKAAKLVNGALISPLPGTRGVQRFPRLGLSVCRSLGVSPAADGWLQGQRRMSPPATSLPSNAVSPVPANAPVTSPPLNRGEVTVPRLQLGIALEGIAKRDVGAADDRTAATQASMDIDCVDVEQVESGGRKRFRGSDLARPPLRTTTNSGPPAATMVPKSARTEFNLNLQSPRGAPGGDGGDLIGQALHRPGRGPPPCTIPNLDLDTSQQNSLRADAPTMLNLEEINMSEEELIRSYDPDNEENNYHLPHHLYKKLQLERYRPVCSEIIKNCLFISSHQVAADIECLRRNQITHIVNTAADACTNQFVGQFHYLTYYLKDANNEEISILFYRTLHWIDEAIQRGGRVLVHCREGVSRSSTMVISFLMWRYSIPFETAHERIRRVRPICNPNTGFTCQLLVLGKKLGVGGGGAQAPPSDRAIVYRVAPYHPHEPFLLLVPADWQWPSNPNFDPRFGWVVQRGLEAVLWIGAQVTDAEGVVSAVKQHFFLQQKFERLETRLTIVQDGLEPFEFWQLMGLMSAPPDRCKFTAPRPSFDDDAELLAQSVQGAPKRADSEELEVSIESITSSETATDTSTLAGETTGRPLLPEPAARPPSSGPPPSVPALSLHGLGAPMGLVGPQSVQ